MKIDIITYSSVYKKLFIEYVKDRRHHSAAKQTNQISNYFLLQFVHRTKRMYALEKHAITVYTKNCFELFSEEVDKATQYDVAEGGEENTFTVIHNNAETRKHWARILFTVKVDEDGEKYYCECGNYEHFGMLCCHAIKVLHICEI